MPISPAQYLREKTPVPAELRTQEWDYVSAQAMERAFVMASVDNARILEAFQKQAARVAEGGASPAEARRALREALQSAGYTPAAGLEGTIKDLTTPRRMNVALETNADMAAGWAERQAALQDVGFPAWRLYRAVRAVKPRDWETRWRGSAEAVNWVGVARGGAMVALVTSPIWAAISRWGTPHAPFDYGSGMDVMPVSFEECMELGLITDSARTKLEQAMAADAESFNAQAEFEPRISSAQMRARLEEDLAGIAEWDNEEKKLRLVDANGTRRYKWDEIGDVLTTRNKANIPLLQTEACAEWMTDSSRFRGGEDAVSLDMREDMSRLVHRIIPTTSVEGGPVFRALQFTDPAKFNAMLRSLTEPYGEEGVPLYTTRNNTVAESWNNNELTVKRYTGKAYNIVLSCEDYQSRRRVDGLYDAVKRELQNPGADEDDAPTALRVNKQFEGLDIATEGESLFGGEVCFRVLKKKPKVYRNRHGGLVYEFKVAEYGKKKNELSEKKR